MPYEDPLLPQLFGPDQAALSPTNSTEMAAIHRSLPPAAAHNPLPPLLHTPAGLALLELQGTINLPEGNIEVAIQTPSATATTTPIGCLDFPDFKPGTDPSDTSWMKRVHLNVGPHQRLTGEVKKLPRPMAVVRRGTEEKDEHDTANDRLHIVEIVHYKLQFSQRPEPMTGLV